MEVLASQDLNCEALVNPKVQSFTCCKYPMFSIGEDVQKNCKYSSCNSTKSRLDEVCCMSECVIGDFFVNGTAKNLKIIFLT